MKKLIKIAVLFAWLSLISSCIAPQRFARVKDENSSIKRQVSDIEAKITDLTRANDSLTKLTAINQKICTTAINQKQSELDKSDRLLEKNQELMKELEKDTRQEQAEMNSMQKDVTKALKSFRPDELTVKMKEGQLYVSLSDKLLFPTGSDVINKRGKQALRMISNVLKKTNLLIRVEGHTDAIPINNRHYKDNWDLSVHRATSVTRVLAEHGISPSRIIASGRSEFDPVASNKSVTGRKLNRRTEIALLPRLDKIQNLLLKGINTEESTALSSNKSAMK